MKIAAAQTFVCEDVSANAAAIKQVLADAAGQGARLVTFCEGALSGYSKAQIKSPEDWASFDWAAQERELRNIAGLCGELGIFAVVGGAHRLEHFPLMWTHISEKELLKIQTLEHVLVRNVEPTFRKHAPEHFPLMCNHISEKELLQYQIPEHVLVRNVEPTFRKHALTASLRPHNSLYVFSDSGHLLTRYDKRFLSNSEINDWYTPGVDPVIFEAGGFRFGCALCIEAQFPEVFMQYEQEGVDAVLFGSYGIPDHFQIALRAHAGLNCIWISAATPAQEAAKGPAGIVGPDGVWSSRCPATATPGFSISVLDRTDPAYDIPLQKARPWRAKAREGAIYREKMVVDARSQNKSAY